MNARLRAMLARTRNADGGWPYLAGRQSRLEPTCWAMLALARRGGCPHAIVVELDRQGCVKEPMVPSVSHTFNAIAALALSSPEIGLTREGTAIASALLELKGIRMAGSSCDQAGLEPSGLVVEQRLVQLGRANGLVHARGQETLPRPSIRGRSRWTKRSGCLRIVPARRVVGTTATKKSMGTALLPQVPTTAAGVLALQDRKTDPLLLRAIDVLRQQAPREGSASALALSWIALTVVKQPEAARLQEQLSQRVEIAESVGNLAVVAMLLYALERMEQQGQPAAFVVPS